MLRVGHRQALGVAQPCPPAGGDQSRGVSELQNPLFLKSHLPPSHCRSLGFWALAEAWEGGYTSSDPPWGSPHLTPPPQVLETCMKSCGKRFHDEVGKFRFLNELIKVVSPKVGAPSARSDLCCQMAVEEG